MKAVLISVQPKWCELIASGKKTIEVRKTRPKINTPFKGYIYCTNNGEILIERKDLKDSRWPGSIYERVKGKVIGEFVCDRITEIVCWDDTKETNIDETLTCLTYEEIEKYGNGKLLYGWHISELKIYDKPKNIKEFLKPCPYGELPCSNCPSCERDENDNLIQCFNTVSRPPQSWCYVEERK